MSFTVRAMRIRFLKQIRRLWRGGMRRICPVLESVAHRSGLADPGLIRGVTPDLDPVEVRAWDRAAGFPVDQHVKEQVIAALGQFSPQIISLTQAEADRSCSHIFDLLGSGPVSLGEKIPWHTDFKTGYCWNPKVYYKRIREAPYPGGYDIKVPWELSRCQHFARMGQAYWFTGDERYAAEFVAQVRDWIESNPWPWGVNWACTMDVAIRAVNWLWGYAFFKESPSLADDFRHAFLASLIVHGRHIFRNLENKGDFTGNHYLADLVGLVYLGILCPQSEEMEHWREFGLRELEQEMFKQVYPDGGDFEASISYHRLATEMFLSATILAQLHGHHFSEPFWKRLEKMVEFVMYITKPDGTVPLIGDNDNGRLHRLKVWDRPEREWRDFRYLLAIGAVLFGRKDFAEVAADQWEEAIWMFGQRVLAFSQQVQSDEIEAARRLQSRAFPDAGIYVMRHEHAYMIVDAGPIGQNGKGGHAHNDALSFELHVNRSWFVDPGMPAYTGDYRARNEFRSTGHHNTVTVNCGEQNRFIPKQAFLLSHDARVRVLGWDTSADADFLAVEHSGYERLENAVTHRRRFVFEKQKTLWTITDVLLGTGPCVLNWNFWLGPRVDLADVQIRPSAVRLCTVDGSVLSLGISGGYEDISVELTEGFLSHSYGRVVSGHRLKMRAAVELPFEVSFRILVEV